MFFRRMFSRKDSMSAGQIKKSKSYPVSEGILISTPRSNRKFQNNSHQTRQQAGDDKRGNAVLQLTPLWEHIIRTHTLPPNIRPSDMFDEFVERLRDPEWQVRQHALRVLVDVLVVLGSRADLYMNPLINQLIENLGHPAPTVRKGALDCLRVYLSETAIPETILLQILDIGLNQKITNEPFGGRLTCGVMLSLPALVQATLHTTKRNYILRTTINMLVNKMTQVTHQEITLKVLTKVKELIGDREFAEYMSHGAHREYELLCSVYGVGEQQKAMSSSVGGKSWKLMTSIESEENVSTKDSDGYWRSSDEEKMLDVTTNIVATIPKQPREKIIMETEIQINEDTVTMRILEAKDDSDSPRKVDNDSSSLDDEIISGNGHGPSIETSGIIQVFSDSEVEEINARVETNDRFGTPTIVTPGTPRTPKRVTFGGEIIKMRTPDSDTVAQSDVDDIQRRVKKNDTSDNNNEKMSFLTVEITNDNTKPMSSPIQSPKRVIRPQTATQSPKRSPRAPELSNSSISPKSPKSSTSPKVSSNNEEAKKLMSPKSPFKRININPVDSIVSPKAPHHEIEVLHNLQRDKSPARPKRSNSNHDSQEQFQSPRDSRPPPQSWEDLGIVDVGVFKDLRSGDWRHRSHAICSIEEALKSSQNLALVQPCLYSLLRTLLSSEKNPEVSEDKRRVVMNLISRLPLDNLEDRTGQIINGLCRQGGPGSNRVSKALMQRLPPAVIVLKLISDDFLRTKSSRFRENALQMVMYALMTFPSTCFDTKTCVTQATLSALDRKKRVRQAALDVLAILGQVVSPRIVMDIVQNVANTRDNGTDLYSAVKSRLSRKQLPAISADGTVQYTLRVPTPQGNDASTLAHLGADIEWIASGVGSVSPTSMKRRAHKYQQQQMQQQQLQQQQMQQQQMQQQQQIQQLQQQQMQQQQQQSQNANGLAGCRNGCHYNYSDPNRNHDGTRRIRAPHEMLAMSVGAHGIDNNGNIDDIRNNMQYVMGNAQPTVKSNNANNGEIIGINGKRIATKACSDSSLDRRNSDSTYTSSTSGSDGCCGSGRFVRQTVTSRFPTVERSSDNILSGFGQNFQNPYNTIIYPHQNLNNLNSTYPKGNFTINQRKPLKANRKQNSVQEAFHESSLEMGNTISAAYAAYENLGTNNLLPNGKRFLNVEKFILDSKQSQPENDNSSSNPVNFNGFSENGNINNWLNDDESSKGSNESITVVQSSSSTSTNKTGDANDSKTSLVSFDDNITSKSSSSVTAIHYEDEEQFDNVEDKIESVKDKIETVDDQIETVEEKTEAAEETIEAVEENIEAVEENIEAVDESSEALNVEEPIMDTATPSRNQSEINLTLRSPSMASMKSQVIEEELDGEAVLDEPDRVSEPTQEVADDLSEPDEDEIKDEEAVLKEEIEVDQIVNSTIDKFITEMPMKELEIEVVEPKKRSRSPTIEEIKSLSRQSSTGKSYESIFNESLTKQDLDSKSTASTETSSEYQSCSLLSRTSRSSNNLVKPQYTPLQRKSKTTLFGKTNRRISPVKKSIAMGQPELYPQSLTAFERPRDALLRSCEQIDSPNWETVMIGLRSMVRLIRYHTDTLDQQMHYVGIQLTKCVRNLRSQVGRAACQAATEFFTTKCKNLEIECDDLIASLLQRTADTNRFIRSDAMRALESMCDNFTPQKVLTVLMNRGATHQNSTVRTAAAKLLNRLGDRLGCEKIYTMGREIRDKFFLIGATLLMEGSLETRSYAKAVFRLMSQHPNYNRYLQEIIPTRTFRNIEKSLKTIH